MKKGFFTSLAIAIALFAGSSVFAQGFNPYTMAPQYQAAPQFGTAPQYQAAPQFGTSYAGAPVAYLGGEDGIEAGCDEGCDGDCGGFGHRLLGRCGLGDCGGCNFGGLFNNLTWYGELEFNFMRYNRADGVQTQIGNVDSKFNYNFELSPRLVIGAVNCTGLGARMRLWDHSHTKANAIDQTLRVDTTNLDFEIFETVDISCASTLEWSIGLRYNTFLEQVTDTNSRDNIARNQFSSWGLTAGVEMNRKIHWGTVYGRARGALFVDDRTLTISDSSPICLNDVTVGQIELALGWETSYCWCNGMVSTIGIGYEFQQWMNYSNTFPGIDGGGTAPVDVGFDGILLSFGLHH